MKKRILITGAGGFVGRHLAEFFARGDYHVTAVCRSKAPSFSKDTDKSIQLLSMDLGETQLANMQCDVVIHAAAVHPNSRITPSITDYLRSNVMATLNVANFARRVRARLFVYLSSVSVYGNVNVCELTEETPLNKPDIYGTSKYAGELILKEYADAFPSLCIRLPGVVGAGSFSPWLGRALNDLILNRPVTIYNPESLFNNVVDLHMMSNFMSSVVSRGLSGFSVVNLAATGPITIRTVIKTLMQHTCSRSKIEVGRDRRASFYINVDKVMNDLMFVPEKTNTILSRFAGTAIEGCKNEIRG